MISSTEILDRVAPNSYWYLSADDYRAMIESEEYQVAVTRQFLGCVDLHKIERQGALHYDPNRYTNTYDKTEIPKYRHTSDIKSYRKLLIETYPDDLMVLDSFVANTSVQIVRCAPWGVKKMVVLRFEFFRENAMVDFQECESEEARQIITDILMKNYKGITIVGDNRLLNIPIKRITYASTHAQERQCIFYERTEEERIQDKIDRVKNQLKQYA